MMQHDGAGSTRPIDKAAQPLRSAPPPTLRVGPVPTAAPAAGSADWLAFLRGFLHHPALVGSVIPSSSRMERRLVRMAGVAQARTIVELGPGTGGTTRAFLRAGGPDLRLLAIELSTEFHDRLQQQLRDPRLTVQHGSAEQIGDFLAQHGLPAPDVVISGIPFSTMPAALGDRIARAVAEVLAPGGCFVAYQLRAHVAGYTRPYLGTPRCEWELLNIPPMRVYRWDKPAG
jgi:phospholipid N-methyltransferase